MYTNSQNLRDLDDIIDGCWEKAGDYACMTQEDMEYEIKARCNSCLVCKRHEDRCLCKSGSDNESKAREDYRQLKADKNRIIDSFLSWLSKLNPWGSDESINEDVSQKCSCCMNCRRCLTKCVCEHEDLN